MGQRRSLTVRKSERERKPKALEDYVCYMCSSSVHETSFEKDPVTVSEALSRPDAYKWKQAMEEEMKSFEESDAWELVDCPDKGTVVDCKWVFKRKTDSENEVRYRARLVAKGFSQKQGIDYDAQVSAGGH